MKAPDKKYPLSVVGDLLASMPDEIYVHKGVHLGMLTLTAIPVDAPGEETYIRKNALIEWLDGCKNNSFITDLQKANIQELIDKINSM